MKLVDTDSRFGVPGHPQLMQNMYMSEKAMMRSHNRRDVKGMRKEWSTGVKGLMTVRVLPEDLFTKVMQTDDPVPPGASVPGNMDASGTAMKMNG